MTKQTLPPTTAATFRERKHRYTSLPVKDVLKIRMQDLDIKNVDLQKALGYAAPNVIAMMRAGSMRLPEGKAIEVADILKLDRTFLLGKVIAENNPELWDAITTIMGDRLVSASELAVVNWLRHALNGHDIDLAESIEFKEAAAPVIAGIVKRENELAQAALRRVDG
ncbi:MAG: hypothetical protein K9J77_12155 [Rhodoferax sp.]|nr:hypothetical protein [Rhodoferax sp.]